MRQFDTGATRDDDTHKLDFEGFLDPFVLERFAQYMHQHRIQADGSLRAADNWQKGIPTASYMSSLIRHVMEVWRDYRRHNKSLSLVGVEALCAVMFNAMGLIRNAQEWGGPVDRPFETAGGQLAAPTPPTPEAQTWWNGSSGSDPYQYTLRTRLLHPLHQTEESSPQ
jgi:hypothetical protein